jgi:aspartate 1-decarboxylase
MAKIHRATVTKAEGGKAMLIRTSMAEIKGAKVTEADLDYVGSITIDENLLDKSGIRPFQYLNITNVSNGVFWETYAMAGPRGKGDICLNGPPARHFQRGDIIIILAEAWVEPSELAALDPVVVFVDEDNQVTEVKRHGAIEPRTS